MIDRRRIGPRTNVAMIVRSCCMTCIVGSIVPVISPNAISIACVRSVVVYAGMMMVAVVRRCAVEGRIVSRDLLRKRGNSVFIVSCCMIYIVRSIVSVITSTVCMQNMAVYNGAMLVVVARWYDF